MGEMVSFPSNGRTANGYLAIPDGGGGPAVIVIQEWWGLVPHIKDVADRLASAGFVALAPDMYDGAETSEPSEAGKMMMAMGLEDAAKHMTGAVDFLLAQDAATSDTAGAIGFCMGGGLVLWLSTLSQRVAAAVPFYGAIPWEDVQPDYSRSRASYLGHYGTADEWASPAVAADLERTLAAQGLDATFHIYEGADHAFFNDSRPEVHDPAASQLAWDRTVEFLRKTLT